MPNSLLGFRRLRPFLLAKAIAALLRSERSQSQELTSVMVRLWCEKFNLSKPKLLALTKSRWFTSRGALSHHHHHHHHHHSLTTNVSTKIITGRTWTQNLIVGQYRTVSSSVGHNVTAETFDSFCNQRNSKVASRDLLKVFDEMPEKNPETWCVMMKCFVSNGYGEEAIRLFTRFKEEGNEPDREMFREVFSAFALTGDVNGRSLHFESMRRDYGITPSMEHYRSVAEMFATSGHLDEALDFVEKMPMEPSVDVWETLMNLARVHGDLELGDRCAELVQMLDATRLDKVSSAGLVATKQEPNRRSKDTSPHPEKRTTYDTIRTIRSTRSRWPEVGYVHTSHQENLEKDTIYETLKSLQSQMLETGYVPDIREYAYRNERVEKESKEERIFGYKEEVPVVKALLSSRPRSSVTVVSNMRICNGCHNAMKLMSEITGRELIKRDRKKYHHFKKGVCSCKDRW